MLFENPAVAAELVGDPGLAHGGPGADRVDRERGLAETALGLGTDRGARKIGAYLHQRVDVVAALPPEPDDTAEFDESPSAIESSAAGAGSRSLAP